MSSLILSANEEIQSIPGPEGILEAVVSKPSDIIKPYIGIVCHPHPLQGGTMNNKVVHTVVKSFLDNGMIAIRFNFRGVGKSAGHYANGIGEIDDVLAVINWAKQLWPMHEVCLAGFSFGAYVSLRASLESPVKMLISIAPAVTHQNFDQLAPNAPWVIIHGDADELIPVQAVMDWIAQSEAKPELIRIANASHFFHGKLIELREILNKEIAKYI